MSKGHRSQIKKARNAETNAAKMPMATAKYQMVSAQKAQFVLNLIRGKSVKEADAILLYQPQKAARIARKVLLSAVANAENNKGMNKDELVVAYATANQGPMLKRIRARAKGRAYRIEKKTSHISIGVDNK